jgi:hypothetical protein
MLPSSTPSTFTIQRHTSQFGRPRALPASLRLSRHRARNKALLTGTRAQQARSGSNGKSYNALAHERSSSAPLDEPCARTQNLPTLEQNLTRPTATDRFTFWGLSGGSPPHPRREACHARASAAGCPLCTTRCESRAAVEERPPADGPRNRADDAKVGCKGDGSKCGCCL